MTRGARRAPAPGGFLLLAAALTAAVAPARAAEDAVAALLAEEALVQTTHPVAAEFLYGEGEGRLTEAEREAAKDQLGRSLRRQTNFMALTMQGVSGVMETDSMRQMHEFAQKNNSVGKMAARSMIGAAPAMPQVDHNQMQAEMEQAMVDPWVRGIGAAQAMVAGGQLNAAATFYTNCLQTLQAKWVPKACLDGILGLGPKKAEKLLTWMLENAEAASVTNAANFGMEPPGKAKKSAPPDQGTVQLRNAALAGLGALVGGGELTPDAQERAMKSLLAWSEGKENELFALGVANGLGRSQDPRALEPLRRIAKRRGDPEAKQAALQGLAVGFQDQAAIKQLRGELDDQDPEEQLRAAQALYGIGDEVAFRWAIDVIGQRRTTDAKKPDIRPQVVRDLVELGGPAARRTLEQALAAGTGNDWLAAWVSVALLELGDLSQLPAVEAALARDQWQLDPRGFRSVWRAIAPFVKAALSAALTGGLGLMSPSTLQQVRQAVQLVGNFAAGERSRSLAKKNRLEAAIAQLRWQTADALAAAGPEQAGAILQRLLADEDPAVRLSAAAALARLDRPDAIAGLAAAFPLDFGAEAGVPRTGAVRAALLRAAILRFPEDPRTRELLGTAAKDPDPGVRFIALVGARPLAA